MYESEGQWRPNGQYFRSGHANLDAEINRGERMSSAAGRIWKRCMFTGCDTRWSEVLDHRQLGSESTLYRRTTRPRRAALLSTPAHLQRRSASASATAADKHHQVEEIRCVGAQPRPLHNREVIHLNANPRLDVD